MEAERIDELGAALVDVRPRTSLGRYRRLSGLDGRHGCCSCRRRVPHRRRLVAKHRGSISRTSSAVARRTVNVGAVVAIGPTMTTGVWLPEIQRDNTQPPTIRSTSLARQLPSLFARVLQHTRRSIQKNGPHERRPRWRSYNTRRNDVSAPFQSHSSQPSRFAGGAERPSLQAPRLAETHDGRIPLNIHWDLLFINVAKYGETTPGGDIKSPELCMMDATDESSFAWR